MTITGIGLGLRMPLAGEMLSASPGEIDFVEVHPENYIDRGGRYATVLAESLARWPTSVHGLTLGFGAVEPTEPTYVARLRSFLDRVKAPWYSDHLCFAGASEVFVHDLLPLPFVKEAVATAARRVREASDRLEVPVAIENISYYAHHASGHRDEAGFVLDVLEASGGGLLLDVNNVFVNSRNHGFDPAKWIERMPSERIVEIHVAGHLVRGDGMRIDTHAEPVSEEVYQLLGHTLRVHGRKPVLLERDDNFPDFEDVRAELRRVRAIVDDAAGGLS